MTHYTFLLDKNLIVSAGIQAKEGMKVLGDYYVEDTSELLDLIGLLQSAVDAAITIRLPDEESN